jgi:cytosine/adenosine deaminase-related metal-dependent hydrolase
LQLLQTQEGPFVDLLTELDAWEPDAFPSGTQPLDYLAILASAQRALIIHGNYLTDEEIAFLAERAEKMSVVYCPRTHEYFRHSRYPLWKMICHGVHMAVGTDSRASNPDLSLFQELRYIAAEHPEVPFDVILQLGTINGARALGLDAEIGSLTPGKIADFVAVPLSPRDVSDPYLLLLLADTGTVQTFLAGAPHE